MPHLAIELTDSYMAMSRALHMTIARNVASIAGLSPATPIRYIGKEMALTMPGSTLDDKTNLGNRLPADQRISIEISETYDENFAATTPIIRPEYRTVFYDARLGVWVHPAYQRILATMTIKLTGPDYATVDTWISTMKRKTSQDFGLHVHEVDYHYHIPPQTMQILFEIHRLRELNCGYGETIGEWLRQCFTPRMDIIANQAGKRNQFVIREKQTEIVGQYDFTANPPKAESENQSGTWTAAFSYNYSFDRVETVVVKFPTVIHNQMLSDVYVTQLKTFEVDDIHSLASLSMSAIRKFSYKRRGSVAWDGTPGVPIPPFDDWLPMPSTTVTNSISIFRALVQLDKNNLHGLLSLTALGNWSLPDEVIEYMVQDPLALLTPYKGLFYLSMYDGDVLMDPRELIVSPNLDITHMRALDERHVYRLCLNMVTELQHLDVPALVTLTEHPVLTNHVLTLINPTIVHATVQHNEFYYGGRSVGSVPVNTASVSNVNRPCTSTEIAAAQNLGALYRTDGILGQLPNSTPVPPLTQATLPPSYVHNTVTPVLPTIYEDGTLLITELKQAIGYVCNTITTKQRVDTARGWQTVAGLIVHAQGANHASV